MVLDAHDRWHPLGFTRLRKHLKFAKCDGVCVVSVSTPMGFVPSRCDHRAR